MLPGAGQGVRDSRAFVDEAADDAARPRLDEPFAESLAGGVALEPRADRFPVRLAVRAGPHRRRHLSLGDEGEVAEADLDEATAHEILIDQPPGPGRIDVSDPEPGLERRLAARPVGGGCPCLRPLLGRRLDAEPCGLPGEKPSIHVALDIRRVDGARRRSQIEEPQCSRERDIARRHRGGIDLGAERPEDGEEGQGRSSESPRSPGVRAAAWPKSRGRPVHRYPSSHQNGNPTVR